MHTNSRIRSRQPMLYGELLHTLLAKIHRAQHLRVLRLQPIQHAAKARTNVILQLRRRLSRALQLTRPRLQRPALRSLSPVAVNHRIAKQTIEPGHNRLASLELVAMLKRPQISTLENVFRHPGIRDTPRYKRKEAFPLGDKFIKRCGHRKVRWKGFTLPPDWMAQHLDANLAVAVHTLTVETTRAVLALHSVLLFGHL